MANGLEVAYRRAGDGPPLVFVHGAAGDGRMWQPQLAALRDEFTVVAWDEPGAGRLGGAPGRVRPRGLRTLPRGADRGARARAGARRRTLLGRHARAGALPPPSRAGRDAGARRHLRRLEGVAAGGRGAGAGRGRAPDARRAARAVRPHPARALRRRPTRRVPRAARGGRRGGPPRDPPHGAGGDGRDRSARPAAPDRRPDPADLGCGSTRVRRWASRASSSTRSRTPSSS